MICYVDRYFVILFCLLHFLFQRNLVSGSEFLTSQHIRTDIIYGDNTAYRAFELLKITAMEIPSPRQP